VNLGGWRPSDADRAYAKWWTARIKADIRGEPMPEGMSDEEPVPPGETRPQRLLDERF